MELKNLSEEFDGDAHYVSQLATVPKQMAKELEKVGSRTENAALKWCRAIDHSSAVLRKKKRYLEPMFVEVAQVFLSIQASSAPVKCILLDAG